MKQAQQNTSADPVNAGVNYLQLQWPGQLSFAVKSKTAKKLHFAGSL